MMNRALMPMQYYGDGGDVQGPRVNVNASGGRRYEDDYIARESEQYDISIAGIPLSDEFSASLEGGYGKTTLDPKFLPPEYRREMTFQQRRVGGDLQYLDSEGRGFSAGMTRYSGTDMEPMKEGRLSAQLPVADGILSLQASKPLNRGVKPRYNLQYERRFASGGAVDDSRTTGLNARILKKAGMPPMDPNQVDPAVVDQVYRILGRNNG